MKSLLLQNGIIKKKVQSFICALLFFPLFYSGYAQNDGDDFFTLPQIHTVKITFTQPNFWDSLTYYYTLDKFMAADVEIDGTMLSSSGVQLKGNSSYNSYPGNKKSMNLDFNEYVAGQDYDGLKKLNLNNGFKDPTMMREKIFLEFCRKTGAPAPRCTYAKVYINGIYWGLYTAVEQVNKNFCGIPFGNNDGNLFKGDPHGTLEWKGSSASVYYANYELKTNEDINDWTDIVYLIDKINNSPVLTYYDSLDKILDIGIYLKSWAASNIFVNLDSYIGSGHNYYIYHDTGTGKFNWITWDVNEAFGNFNQGMSLSQIKTLDIFYIPSPAQSRPLNNKILKDVVLKEMYVDAGCIVASDYFDSTYLYPLIDSLADKIRTDLYADTAKMYSNQDFETNINSDLSIIGTPGGGNIAGLKSFITERRASLYTQLSAWDCYLNADENNLSHLTLSIYPNPASAYFFINFEKKTANKNIPVKLIDYTGKTVYMNTITDEKTIIDVSKLTAGIYMMVIDNTILKKVEIIH